MRKILQDIREALPAAPANGKRGATSSLGAAGGNGRRRAAAPEKPKDFTYRDLGRLLPYARPNWRMGVAAALLALLCTALVAVLPMLFKLLADDAVLRGDRGLLNRTIALIIGVLVAFTVADFLKQVYFNRFQQEIVFRLQHTVIDKLLHMPKSFFDSNSTGYLMSRGLGDTLQLQSFLSLRLVDFFAKGLQLVVVGGILVYLNWKLTLLSLGVLPLFVLIARVINGRAREMSRTALERTAIVSRDLEETLAGAALIKAFAAEEREGQRLLGSLQGAFQANLSRMSLSALFVFLSGLTNAVGMGLVLWYGASLVIERELSVGELLAFSAYLGFLIQPAMFLANAHNNFQHAFAALERVFELIKLAPEADGEGQRSKIERIEGRVRFERVSFSYDGRRSALEDVSFEALPGQVVSIVGPSGAGKTTLVNLILGLYQPTSGGIFYDEVPSARIELQSLRQRVGIVSQELFLFNDSVMNNIRFGRLDASDEEVVRAARIASADSFISQFPEGYETPIGEKGVRLSVGQRQRLSIARTILKDPDVLILDEATSALDPLTEQAVQTMLKEFCLGKTVFVIAHRLSTVMTSDLILTLDQGRVAQCGTHRELFEAEGLYRRLCLTQFFLADQVA